jgi:Tfp pilus assembly protein PilP
MASIFSRAIARLTIRHVLPSSNRDRFNDRRRKGLLRMILPMLLCYPLIAQDTKKDALISADQVKKAAEAPIKYSGVRYQSGNRRDPFLNPLLLKKKAQQQNDEEISRGLPPPGIAGTYIAQATLQGITSRNSEKVAIVRGADSRAYFLKVGDRLFDGYVKEIQNDSITLVRETKLKSGKTLTQDVTKRLRTP